MTPEDVKSYIEQVASRKVPYEIERRRLPCEHYHSEVNLFVAALLGLTTLDNIAQMGVQATSTPENSTEEPDCNARLLLTLAVLVLRCLMTRSSMQLLLH